jgi:acyl carrier protein/predicted DNA-binding protein YlxM (UPF0122 family)
LQRGECQLAIAGGVNVSIHPNKYLMLGMGKFVSSKGRCESFGQGGDGYVPGEGVGAVLLKPLQKAIADGDHIYGVIKATALNHGGKTNGYSVPNPNAQTSVIGAALKEAGIDPRTISYIEAHGTGTVLGDPIEITGLTKSFQEYTKDKQFCAIGSAKSNIGHCESAAGIAGVTKVLLQLKHRQLAPSLHSKTLNPNIDFANTPFIVQQELAEWKRPVVTIDAQTREYPRIAGISSFGAGGSNAHVVIEEYIPNQEKPAITVTSQKPAIIVLSAKNEDRLKEHAQQLLQAIQTQQFSDVDLTEIAYTLQVGREAMEERLAMTVVSLQELEEKLKNYLDGQDNVDDLYRGQIKRNKEMLAVFTEDEDMVKTIDAWIAKGKYAKLLDLWVKGFALDWKKLYGNTKPHRISLPTYPFSRERYWYTDLFEKESVSRKEATSPAGDKSSSVSQQSMELRTVEKPTISDVSGKPRDMSLRPLSDDQKISSQPGGKETTSLVKDISAKSSVTLQSMELRTVERPTISNTSVKPSEISLRSQLEYQKISSTPVGQIQQSIILSPASLPLSQVSTISPKVNDESKPKNHIQTVNSVEYLQEELVTSLAEALYMKPSDVDVDTKFVDMGMDSIIGVAWVQGINKRYETSIATTKVYDYPTISEFAEFMEKELNIPSSRMISVPATSASEPIETQAQVTSKPIEAPAQVTFRPIETQAQMNSMQSHASVESIQEELVTSLAEALYMKRSDVDVDTKFVDMGMDSIIGVAWVQEINKRYGTSIATTKVYDYPTISEFAEFVEKELNIPSSRMISVPAPSASEPIETQAQMTSKPIEAEVQVTSKLIEAQAQVTFKPIETQAQMNSMQSHFSVESIQEELVTSLAEALYMKRSDVDVDTKFVDMGMDSIIGVAWVQEINKRYGTSISTTKVYDYPTISEFAGFVKKELNTTMGESDQTPANSNPDLSLQAVLQQVREGTLNLEQADQLLNQYGLKEETK